MKTADSLSAHQDETVLAPEWMLMLQAIHARLDDEVKAKQNIIESQMSKIASLENTLLQQLEVVAELNTQLSECTRTNEGKKQLINKLLGDIARLSHDVEWYKRTYEKRTLLGTLKEKFINRKK